MKFFRHFGTCVNWATSMLTLWVNILEQQKTISPALILIKTVYYSFNKCTLRFILPVVNLIFKLANQKKF